MDKIEPENNAGCARCGVNDREKGFKNCTACLDEADEISPETTEF